MSQRPEGKPGGDPGKDRPDAKQKRGGLGGLAAQLVQQGLLSENRARALAREQRAEDRGAGRKAVEAREHERRQEATQRQAEGAREHREQAKVLGEAERLEQVRKTIEQHRAPPEQGNRRWFFVARDRRVPFVSVSDGLATRLEQGEAGVVEAPPSEPGGRVDHVLVLGRDALGALWTLDRDAVRFWNRG